MLVAVIPACDEADTIGHVLQACFSILPELTNRFAVVVVDDHSTDKTAQIASSTGATVIENSQQGLASAFQTGVRYAVDIGAEYIVHLDADGQYYPSELPLLLKHARPDTLVIGDRLLSRPPGMSDVRFVWNRYLSELIASMVPNSQVTDSQSGFRVFHRSVAQIPIRSRLTYTQEQIIRAAHAGYMIVQPPISFTTRVHGSSRLVSSAFDYLSRVFADLNVIAEELEISSEKLVLPSASIAFVSRRDTPGQRD